jgi:2-polyprenyl-3-methyl-5-hydroxy-6-metoxy-1,4-benzoquinol methylase
MPVDEHLKKVVAHHDWWSETYDSEYFEHFALYHRVTLDNIKRFLPREKDAIILDAGGGTGICSVELAKLGYRVVLTDISE